MKDDKQEYKESRPHNSTSNHFVKPSKGGYKGKGKGKDSKGGKSNPPSWTRSVYVTEVPEQLEPEADDPEPALDSELSDGEAEPAAEDAYEEEPPDEFADPEDDDPQDDFDLAAHCLTVTARRLSGLRLGRKFSGSKSVQQRKAESHCIVCGAKGHWQNDPECPLTGSKPESSTKGGGKGSNKSDKASAKKVMTVQHSDGSKRQVSFGDDVKTEGYGTYFTYMVNTAALHPPSFSLHQVFGSQLGSFSHHLILDTACQRTCCSSTWLSLWESSVSHHRLKALSSPQREPFEFGHGPTQYSCKHVYLPNCFNHNSNTCCLLGASVLENTNDIPLLGSNVLLSEKLQAVLDLPKREAFLGCFGCAVPILVINGHLALDVSSFF